MTQKRRLAVSSSLINRPHPYPDEWIGSYLRRLAYVNHYNPPGMFQAWLFETLGYPRRTLTFFERQPEFYETLAVLTRHEIKQIYQLTDHRFAHVLLAPNVNPEYLQIGTTNTLTLFPWQTSFFSIRHSLTAAFCPHCLRDKNYVRLHWRVVAVSVCLTHRCFLVDQCQGCHEYLSDQSVKTGCCAHCGFELRQSSAQIIAVDDAAYLTQFTVQAWLYDQQAPSEMELPSESGRILFRVLNGLRFAIQSPEFNSIDIYRPKNIDVPIRDRRSSRKLTIAESVILYTTAMSGLRNWPTGFYNLLDAMRQISQPNGQTSIGKAFRGLDKFWLQHKWNYREFDFLQNAFNEYLITNFTNVAWTEQVRRFKRYPDLPKKLDLMTTSYAASQSDFTSDQLRAFARDGVLDTYPRSDESELLLLYRSQVESLDVTVKVEGKRITKNSATHELGLSINVVNDLIEAGLIKKTGQRRHQGKVVPALTNNDLTSFLESLYPFVTQKTQPPIGEFTTLSHVHAISGGIGLRAVTVLNMVLRNEIRAWHPSENLLPLSSLYFSTSDIEKIVSSTRDANNWMLSEAVRKLLGISRKTFHHWFDHGLLIPVASDMHTLYFDSREVIKLHENLVRACDAAIILETQKSYVSKWVRFGYLDAVSGPIIDGNGVYIFDRRYLARWREKYMSAGAVRQLLNTTDGPLRLLRDEGRLTSITKDSNVPGIYLRSDIILLKSILQKP